MNNRKQMGNPEGAEAELAAEEAARTSPSWGLSHKAQEAMGSEIRNLPDNLSLTKDRLLNNICRICATYHEAGPKMLPLFYYDKGTRPLAKLVNTLLSVKVVAKDGLPKFACRECACKLFTWSAMRDSAADVQKMLLSQAELLDRGHQHRIIRSENEAEQRPTYFMLHFVDLTDSSSESGSGSESEAPPAPARAPEHSDFAIDFSAS